MKQIIKYVIGVLFVLSSAYVVKAEQGIEQARNIENLSNNSILSLYQDRRGFVWMGSYDGLNCYDGKHVNVFRFEQNEPTSLSGNIISEIYDAGGDDMWVLTSMGLDKFSTTRLQAIEHYPEIRGERHLMATDSLGHAFVYQYDGGLLYYNPLEKCFQVATTLEMPRRTDIISMIVDSDDTLWLFTSGCDVVKVWYNFEKGYLKPSFSWHLMKLHDVAIASVFKADNGFFLLDVKGQLYYSDFKGKGLAYLTNLDDIGEQYGRIVGVTMFEGDIFLAFTGIGLGKLNGAENYRFEMVSDEVGMFRLMRDIRQPLLWCATDGRGLYKVYDIHTRYNTIHSSQIPNLSKPIRTFYTDLNDNLWIGTKGDGMIIVSDYVKQTHGRTIPESDIRYFSYAEGLPDNQVFSIKESRFHPERVWIATRGPGISYASMPQASIKTFVHKDICGVHDIYEQNDSVLWLASTTNGLVRVVYESNRGLENVKSVETFTFRKNGYVCGEIYSMAYDGRNSLYIACRGGLGIVRFNIFTKTYDFVNSVTETLPGIGDVICLSYTADSMLCFGSSACAGILDCRNADSPEIARVLTQRDGMINDMTHSILSDGHGNVWISTNKGLVRYNPQADVVHNIAGFGGDIREFCDNSGYISPYNGDLIFGALNGVVWVSSENMMTKGDKLSPHFGLTV